MNISKTGSWWLLSASVLLGSTSVMGACTSDTPSTQDGGSPSDALAPGDSSTPAEAGPDTSTEASADASADASTDASIDTSTDTGADVIDSGACATYADGSYTWGIWTCTSGARTIDVKAFAIGLGIQSVDHTVTGTHGVINVSYSGGPPCTRSTAFVLAYPSCGTIRNDTATTYTCTATCAPATCTSGNQAATVHTYTFSRSGSTFTTTRTLDAASVQGLPGLAGCQVGDTEIATTLKL